MLVGNSNLKGKQQSLDQKESVGPLLLKPTGVPVFTPIDTMKTMISGMLEGASTMETTNENFAQRTVQTKSFVIGKRVENQTGINLIDLDNLTATQERPFPVKVLYMKPSHEHKSYRPKSKQDLVKPEKENADLNTQFVNLGDLPLTKDFPKVNAVDAQLKMQEQKHRPKSATTQQIAKAAIKHSKLGPTTKVKPQISYVKKVSASQPSKQPKIDKPKAVPQKEQILSPVRQQNVTEIPFAENRLKGQFPQLTKELFKKAQEALKTEKDKQKRQKEELQQKKEKQKLMQEEVKKLNQELVEKQKEKGCEHIDLRKKEQEKQEQARKKENKEERERQKELRDKRKQEGRKQLGLDIFNEDKVEEYRKKVKEAIPVEPKIKVVQQERPKSSNPIVKHLNKDLKVQMREQQQQDQIDEVEEQGKKEQQKREREQLLKEQKKRRKVQQQQQQAKQEEEKRKKEEALLKLELELRVQKEENLKRQEMKQKMREEHDRLQRELDQLEEFEKKKKLKQTKKAKAAPSGHKEQMDELRNWIEEQMAKEEAQDSDEEILKSEKPSKFMVKIDKKDSQEQPNVSYISGKSGSQKSGKGNLKHKSNDQSFNNNSVKQLKFDLPGNMDLEYQDGQKYAARQNRYGIFGDNGYSELIEIKRRQMDDPKSKDPSLERKQDIRLSKDGLVTVIQKITEYHQQQQKAPSLQASPAKDPNRVVLIDKQRSHYKEEVPGVVSIEQELKRQRKQQQLREVEATVVIQKWSRGFLARHEVRVRREDKRRQIEEEYGYFEDQVKFNSDYNLQKFLREKQKMREQNKTKAMAEDSINEKIGESSTLGKSLKQSVPQQAMMQNFFREKSDKDPLSIIELFAKRNAPKVVPSVQKSPARQSSKRRPHDSDIEEEIYTESFEEIEDEVKSKGTIEEDIVGESRGMSSGSQKELKPFKHMKNQPFAYQKQSSIQESIQEEFVMSVDRRSRRSPDRYGGHNDSSIIEESGLQVMSASKSSYQKRGSMIEESINEIKSDYEEEFDSYSGSAQRLTKVDKQKQVQLQRQQHEKQVKEFEEKLQADQTKRKTVVNELLTEMKRYEEASMSTVVVERMEKIICQSLAQKDKLLLGQRLHELELEKKHKDEINKIREEQIKLLSQLVLMGGSNGQAQNEEERKAMMENIEKMFDKPIVIQKQLSSESEKFVEKEEIDYIAESKASRKVDDSIKESIEMSGSKNEEDDGISEDIVEASDSKESEDEIKESLYVDGKKLQDKPKVDQGLSKMRMALGSEEAVRQQSKKTLQGDKEKLKSSGLFNKHSFEDFTHQKFKQLLFDKKAPAAFLDQIDQAIDDKHVHEQRKLKQELKKNLISPRTFKKKERELEKWVSNERQELQQKKKKMVQTFEEVGSYLNKMEKDKKVMLEVIGSPRPQKRLFDSQSSLDYEEMEEESNESVRVRQARSELQKLTKSIDKSEDPMELEIRKKKATAKKLMEQKERAIEEGLKEKLKTIEAQQVDNMLNLALKMDVQQEIEKRMSKARKALEESSENFDSARSFSQSAATIEEGKKKKNVKFASPEKYSNYDQSSEGGVSSNKQRSQRLEDSIGESIKIEDSYNISSSIPVGRSQSTEKHPIQESIKESVGEDDSSYSEDFASQSHISQSNKNLGESRNKLVQKVHTLEEQDDIAYSMNFDEDSMSQSQFNSVKPSEIKQVTIPVQEESADQEEDEEVPQISKKESDSNDINEEMMDGSGSMGTSSKFHSSMPAESEVASEDREVVHSTRSVEWQINLEVETQRKSEEDEKYSEDFEEVEELLQSVAESKQEETQKEESENNLDDLESFPDDIEESFDDFQAKADKFTDEFFELLLNEIRENPELNINQVLDEGDFKDKFPFNLEPEIDEKPVGISEVKVDTIKKKEEPVKRESAEDQARAKYEQELKKQQEQAKHIEQYLELMIGNINKQDLINSMERPIDIDPLKKLALIFQQQENQNVQDESLHMDSSKEQSLLPLDFFIQVEDDYKRKYSPIVDLTESARQTYLEHENVHHKAIFDAFNQALDLERPYKEKGQPAPWSKQTRVVKPKITHKQLEQILKKSKERVQNWCKTQAGTRLAPVPAPPPQTNDYDNPPQAQPLQPEEERVNGAREERLGMLMMKELEENENKWIDYEDEDTQVKFDLADMILDDLAGELVGLILGLQQRK